MKIAHALLVVLCIAIAPAALAQDYPTRPIALVVPFAAGGGTDSIARELAEVLKERLGQTVVVDNRGGGGGSIAADEVAHSKPDGYMLLFVTSSFVTAAATERKLPYDVQKSFTPVALLGRGPLLLVVNKDLPVNTVADLVKASKAHPEFYNFVSAGPGSINHLAGELFKQRTGAMMTHVPYKGSGPATIDLVSGAAQVFFATVPTIMGQVKARRVRAIATTSARRSPLFPDIPTVQESGVKDYSVETWWGIVGPAGLPADVVAKLNAAINAAAATPPFKSRFAGEGAEQFFGTPQDLGNQIARELAGWRRVVREGDIRID